MHRSATWPSAPSPALDNTQKRRLGDIPSPPLPSCFSNLRVVEGVLLRVLFLWFTLLASLISCHPAKVRREGSTDLVGGGGGGQRSIDHDGQQPFSRPSVSSYQSFYEVIFQHCWQKASDPCHSFSSAGQSITLREKSGRPLQPHQTFVYARRFISESPKEASTDLF
jgi:hypothetical protein